MELQPVPNLSRSGFVLRTVVVGVVVAVAAVAVVVGLLRVMGLRLAVVDDHQMAGGADKGSVLILRKSSPNDLRVGDTVVLTPPAPYGDLGRVSRRVTSAAPGLVTTTVDGGLSADPWTISVDHRDVYRTVAAVPLIGFPFLSWVTILITVGLLAPLAMIPALLRRRRRPSTSTRAPSPVLANR